MKLNWETILLIQYHNPTGNIRCTASQYKETNKYFGCVCLYVGEKLFKILLFSDPVFKSDKIAIQEMEIIVQKACAVDLLQYAIQGINDNRQ